MLPKRLFRSVVFKSYLSTSVVQDPTFSQTAFLRSVPSGVGQETDLSYVVQISTDNSSWSDAGYFETFPELDIYSIGIIGRYYRFIVRDNITSLQIVTPSTRYTPLAPDFSSFTINTNTITLNWINWKSDLQTQIYRDGVLRTTVAAGVSSYDDPYDPPPPSANYEYYIRHVHPDTGPGLVSVTAFVVT